MRFRRFRQAGRRQGLPRAIGQWSRTNIVLAPTVGGGTVSTIVYTPPGFATLASEFRQHLVKGILLDIDTMLPTVTTQPDSVTLAIGIARVSLTSGGAAAVIPDPFVPTAFHQQFDWLFLGRRSLLVEQGDRSQWRRSDPAQHIKSKRRIEDDECLLMVAGLAGGAGGSVAIQGLISVFAGPTR